MAEQEGGATSMLSFTDNFSVNLGKSKPFPLLRLRNIIMKKQPDFGKSLVMFGET